MVTFGSQKDLGLMLQSAEGLTMKDAVPVLLKSRPYIARGLWPDPSLCLGTELGSRRQELTLLRLQHDPDVHP